MFNFFVKVIHDSTCFFVPEGGQRGACVLWRTPDAPAYPVLYTRYGHMHTWNLQLKAWKLQL